MEYEVIPSKIQVDFKVMVKIGEYDSWEDFTGLFLMKDGWDDSKVTQHIQQYFSTDQFKKYTFGLFKRYFKNTTGNNSFKFEYGHDIKLIEEDV